MVPLRERYGSTMYNCNRPPRLPVSVYTRVHILYWELWDSGTPDGPVWDGRGGAHAYIREKTYLTARPRPLEGSAAEISPTSMGERRLPNAFVRKPHYPEPRPENELRPGRPVEKQVKNRG